MKLDSTIDRRALRAQIARLGELGYALDFKTQGGAARPNCNLRDRRRRMRGVLHPPAGVPSPCGEALGSISGGLHHVHHRAISPLQRWMNPRGGLSARRQPHNRQRVADCPHDYYVERFSSAIDATTRSIAGRTARTGAEDRTGMGLRNTGRTAGNPGLECGAWLLLAWDRVRLPPGRL